MKNEKLKESFGLVLLGHRKKSGLSQQALADNCDLERRFITDLEKGKKQPTITTILKLSEYFQIMPGDMLNEAYTLMKKGRK